MESDFELRLAPLVPDDHDLFAGDPALKLVVRDATSVELSFLDEAGAGSPSLGNRPPLVGAHVGLLIEEAGGPKNRLNTGRMSGWGEAGPFDLARGGETEEVELLVSGFARFGTLGALPTPLRYTTAAVTSSGAVWLFGGAPDPFSAAGSSTDAVLRLEDLDSGDWTFEAMTPLGRPLAQSAAVVIGPSEQEEVLVTGGRSNFVTSAGNQTYAALYNADSGEQVWASTGFSSQLRIPRSDHTVVRLSNGRVLLLGGITNSGDIESEALYESFDPNTRAFTRDSSWVAPVASVGVAGTAIGEEGALFCGGATFENIAGGYTETPSARCAIIGLDGVARAAAALPTAVSLPAMTTLLDGRVLLTGGITETVVRDGSGNGSGQTTTLAWIYDPHFDAWSPVGGLSQARAAHAIVATPSGGAVVIGGTSSGGVLFQQLGEPVDCTEVFDVSEDTWTVQRPCSAGGGGAFPAVASSPDQGAFVLAGGDADDDGGRTFGIVSLGPRLPTGQEP